MDQIENQLSLDDYDKERDEEMKKLLEEHRETLSKTPLGRIILQATEKFLQDNSHE